jgi:hypothetical protein
VLQRLGELFVEELTRGMRPDPGTEGEVNPAGLLPRAGLLCGTLQVPPGKVILGHLNRLPDLSLQPQTAETGAFLAFRRAVPGQSRHRLAAVREPGRAGQKVLAWACAHCRKVRGARPVTSCTSGWTCDSSRWPAT